MQVKKARIVVEHWIASKEGIPHAIDALIVRETDKALLIKGHALADSPICCVRCGADLTHPASRLVGVKIWVPELILMQIGLRLSAYLFRRL